MIRKILFVILLFLPTFAIGDMGDFARDYISEMAGRNASVFYSQCVSKVTGQYTAVLIFEAGSKKGLLIEKKDKTVINLATVMIGEKGLTIEETHGGMYTYDRVKKLIDELAGYKFRFLSPVKINDLENTTNNICTNRP